MATAEELHDRGVAAVNRGHFRRSRSLLLQARAASADADRTARIVATLAYVESELGDREAGLRLCAEALHDEKLSPHARAVVRGQHASLLLRGGEPAAALPLFDLALPCLGAGTTERGNLLMNRGVALLELGEYDRAEDDFAAAASDLADDPLARAGALHNRGYAALKRGDLVAALTHMGESATVIRGSSAQLAAVSAQDRAEVLLAAGRVAEAITELETATARFADLRLPRMRAECEFVLARALAFTDPARARIVARAAARRLRRHGNTAWAQRADTLERITEALTGRAGSRWLDETETLASALREHGMQHEAQLLDLYAARTAVGLGRLDEARERLDRGRTNVRDSLTERLLERSTKAELALATGRRRTALHHLCAGLDLMHDWQASFGSLDLMSSLVGHGRTLAARGIGIALEDGSPELVFEWSERARALTTRVVPVRPPHDPVVAADLVEIRELTVTEPEAGTPEAHRLVALRERVRERSWLGAGSGEVRTIAGLDAVEAALGTDTALVSYLWDGATRIHALVVTDAGRTVHDLGDVAPVRRLLAGLQADLDVGASALSPAMSRIVLAGRERRLGSVSDMLVAPVMERVGDRRVVITQAGTLAGIPWSMLPHLVGRPVTVASAATRWLATRGLGRPRSAAFVAGPDVARAPEEVKQAASRWTGSVCLTDTAATVEATIAAADGVDLLHVSAHGRHAAENPLFSAVLLADGPLFGYDLDRIARVPQVVILSACEVGRSTQRWAEESLGMVNAWLHAGARCVIASPAAVADDEACEVLQDVHRLMAAGTPPGVALAEATADRPTSFVCFGAGW